MVASPEASAEQLSAIGPLMRVAERVQGALTGATQPGVCPPVGTTVDQYHVAQPQGGDAGRAGRF
jgi:hypothetical protein